MVSLKKEHTDKSIEMTFGEDFKVYPKVVVLKGGKAVPDP